MPPGRQVDLCEVKSTGPHTEFQDSWGYVVDPDSKINK